MMKRVLVLGWFFLTAYNGTQKFDFANPDVCNAARARMLVMLTKASTATTAANRIDATCAEDPAKPVTVNLDGLSLKLDMDSTGTFTEK